MGWNDEIRKMQEMKDNYETYGMYVLNKDLPKYAKTKKDLYRTIGALKNFDDVQDLFRMTKDSVERLAKDTKYSDEYKKETIEQYYKQLEAVKKYNYEQIERKLLKYREDLATEYAVEEMSDLALNNALLQFQIIDGMGNAQMMEQFLQANMNSSVIRGLVQAKYGDENANIAQSIKQYEKEIAKPFQDVDKELATVRTFIQNEDYIVDDQYLENNGKISQFIEIRGEKRKDGKALAREHNNRELQDNTEGQEVQGTQEN